MTLVVNLLKQLWNYVRTVSGENDYVRYCTGMAAEGCYRLNRQEFYENRQQGKYLHPNGCCEWARMRCAFG